MKFHSFALTSALAVALFATSCQNTYVEPERNPSSTADENADHNFGGYTGAQSSADLGTILDRDLQQGEGAIAFRGLELFVQNHIIARTTTWGHNALKEVRPVTRFQFAKQSRYLNGVKELEKQLARESGKDLATAYAAARNRDYTLLRTMLETNQGLLHPSTVAMDSELRPHAALFASLVAYDDLSNNENASEADVNALFANLASAREELGQANAPEGLFMTDVAWAQALEQQGDHDAAGEIWLRITESDYWTQAPEPVRNAIAARITSYTTRLRNALAVQLENERRAELARQAKLYEAHANAIAAEQAALTQEVAKDRQAAQSTASKQEALARQVAQDRETAQANLQDLQSDLDRYQTHTHKLEAKHTAFASWVTQANTDTQTELARLESEGSNLKQSLVHLVDLITPEPEPEAQAGATEIPVTQAAPESAGVTQAATGLNPEAIATDVLSLFADAATSASALSRFLPKRFRFRL